MIVNSQSEILHENIHNSKGIDISFMNLSYSVQIQAQNTNQSFSFHKEYITKTIIDNVSGIFKAGEVSAIMGASGAGKTTLLNLIACRIDQDKGQKLANDERYTYQDFGYFANYVMQTDALMSTLTVRQTLNFAANLKMICSEEQKKTKVERLILQLKLENCQDTLIGSHLIKGISGGQKKRTSIAFELLSNPQVIVLDEPTSGLDSLTSYVIIQYLQKLSKEENKTVIMTIHQPNSDIFELFDRVLLMAEGKLVFQGSTSQSRLYFQYNFGFKCPQFFNPADYFMKIIHPEDLNNRLRYEHYFMTYKLVLTPKIDRQIANRNTSTVEKRRIKRSLATTYKELVYRDFINIIRNPLMIKSRLFQTIFLYLYIGGLYTDSLTGNYLENNSWLSYLGVLNFIALNTMMVSLVPLTITFAKEREVFLKEEGSKLYSTTAYFISRNIIEIPYAFIFPIIQSLIVYWFAGLSNTATQFFTFYLALYLQSFVGMSMGLLLGSVIIDQKIIPPLTPSLAIVVSLFSGFFKNLDTLPQWIGWLQYLSPIRYCFEALVRNEVRYASESNLESLNFNLTLWASIGLLFILGVKLQMSQSLFSVGPQEQIIVKMMKYNLLNISNNIGYFYCVRILKLCFFWFSNRIHTFHIVNFKSIMLQNGVSDLKITGQLSTMFEFSIIFLNYHCLLSLIVDDAGIYWNRTKSYIVILFEFRQFF